MPVEDALNEKSLAEVASSTIDMTNASAKPVYYYEIYDSYFRPLRHRPGLRLVEIGVCQGDSLKVLGNYFSDGHILGIDIDDKSLDLSAFPNTHFEQCDQTDKLRLQHIVKNFAPEGIDVLIDDASHVGWYSKLTFEALLAQIKPGGLYIVEDWGTGYIGNWFDGGPFKPASDFGSAVPKRLPSHDYGMVGFVKSLVDTVWTECIRDTFGGQSGPVSLFSSMHIHKAMVVLRKSP